VAGSGARATSFQLVRIATCLRLLGKQFAAPACSADQTLQIAGNRHSRKIPRAYSDGGRKSCTTASASSRSVLRILSILGQPLPWTPSGSRSRPDLPMMLSAILFIPRPNRWSTPQLPTGDGRSTHSAKRGTFSKEGRSDTSRSCRFARRLPPVSRYWLKNVSHIKFVKGIGFRFLRNFFRFPLSGRFRRCSCPFVWASFVLALREPGWRSSPG